MPVFTLVLALLVTGCGAGFDATTMQTQPANSGVYSKIGDMYVQNAQIVITPDNSGTIIATLINDGAEVDRLVDVTVSGPTPQEIAPNYEGELEIPAGGFVVVGSQGAPEIKLLGFSPAESAYVKVSFLFERAGELRLSLLTVPLAVAATELTS